MANDEILRKVNALRQRVRSAETTMTEMRVKHEQASEEVRLAQDRLAELGVTDKDLEDVDAFMSDEVVAIEALISKVETDLDKAKRTADGE